MSPAGRRSSIPLVQNRKLSPHQRASEIRSSCVDAASPFVNGRIVNRTTSPSHVGFLMIPYESIEYNNSFTMLLVRDFTESLQFLGSEAWSIFPSSSCPKLAAHTTKHIATSLPGTPKVSVVPPRDSSNRGRKTLGSSSGPKHNRVVSVGFTSQKGTIPTYFGYGSGARSQIGRKLATALVSCSAVAQVVLMACSPSF